MGGKTDPQLLGNDRQRFAINSESKNESSFVITGNFSLFDAYASTTVSLSQGSCPSPLLDLTAQTISCTFSNFPNQTGLIFALVSQQFSQYTPIFASPTPVHVAEIVEAPSITSNANKLAMNAQFLTIFGTNLDNVTLPETTLRVSLSIPGGASTPNCQVSSTPSLESFVCTNMSLTETGNLLATAFSFGGSTGSPVKVAQIVDPPSVVRPNPIPKISVNTDRIIIQVYGASKTVEENQVQLFISSNSKRRRMYRDVNPTCTLESVSGEAPSELTCVLNGVLKKKNPDMTHNVAFRSRTWGTLCYRSCKRRIIRAHSHCKCWLGFCCCRRGSFDWSHSRNPLPSHPGHHRYFNCSNCYHFLEEEETASRSETVEKGNS